MFAEWRDASKIFLKARSNTFEPLDMRDVTTAFDREQKIAGRFFPPSFDHVPRRKPIKRGVDFDGRKLRGVKRKFIRLLQIFRVKTFRPMFVHPSAGPDPNASLLHVPS